MRKYLLALTIAVCSVIGASAQYFVIDPQDPSMVVIGLGDNVSSLNQATCVGGTYKLDIDNNGVDDFQFDHLCQWGSSTGFIDHIKVKSFDGAYFVSDTAVTDTLPTITMIAKPFGINDTVDYNSDFTNAVTFISRSEYASWGEYIYYVTDWHGAARYMAIRKEINGQQYYGWIKIHVLDLHKAAYIEYALNYPYLNTPKEPSTAGVFPNPFTTWLQVAGGVDRVTITDMSGKLVYMRNATGKPVTFLNLEELSRGTYLLFVDDAAPRKIIKM